MLMCRSRKPQSENTASPDKYPQGYFKPKKCRWCGNIFNPNAPSHLFCSQECADAAGEDNYFRRTYGICRDEYLDLLDKQNGKCAICGGEGFVMNKDRHKAKLVVDHDHATGKVRGLLCHNCNRALGLLHDNVEHFNVAIKYLEGATTIPQGSRG